MEWRCRFNFYRGCGDYTALISLYERGNRWFLANVVADRRGYVAQLL